MAGWVDGWMFTLVISLVLEDKLGERKEHLQLRRHKLLCLMVPGNLLKFSNSQNSRLLLSSDELKDHVLLRPHPLSLTCSTKISQAYSFHARHPCLCSATQSFCMRFTYLYYGMTPNSHEEIY